MTYNGFKNYATWLVALHLRNDQGLSELAVDTAFESSVEEFEEWVTHYVCRVDDVDSPLSIDLLRSILRDVDFAQVIESFLEDETGLQSALGHP